MSDSVRHHRRQPTRLPRPWDSPGKNTGVGCHFLLPCMKVKSESEVAQSCPTLCDPIDCSLPGSSAHGFSRQEYWSGVPLPNHMGPHKRYQWPVLPQGMMNSPTMCQYYVAKALEPVRKQFPNFLVIHYMDDTSFLARSILETQHV